MFNLFGSKTKVPYLSFLGVDMHSHLLPGLDDGLKTLEETISFMQQLQTMGYQKFICTPHILSDMHPNTPETILPKLDLVRNELLKRNINIEVEAAAEYMIDMEFEQLIDSGKPLLCFGSKNYILIEMSYLAESQNFEKIIFNLQMKGWKPIFAHPERYNFWHKEFDKYEAFIDKGFLLQMNINSFTGYYSFINKKSKVRFNG